MYWFLYLDNNDNDNNNETCFDSINNNDEVIYFCGNSLGLMPKNLEEYLQQELTVWKSKGVEGHFNHQFNRPWKSCDELVRSSLSSLVG